eukprot:TRINITY_DN5583_c0_g1_i2.p1 TRINITY_DN5583_c0_g1~~TRINITY_DN5583_c0_g1_i2.p1  ORF type:complete len:753 (+),score=81.38 TRINITY_DN5583_c0_g1_i2:75-2333(+)
MPCSELGSCGTCLWDASNIHTSNSSEGESCIWCADTSLCLPHGSECLNTLNTSSVRWNCPDLQCLLARVSFNVYVCEVELVFWVSVMLVLLNILYLMWVSAVAQKPWRVPGLGNTARMTWLNLRADIEEDLVSNENDEVQIPPEAAELKCPRCSEYKECPGCFLTRLTFLPSLISLTTSASNIISALFFSLRSHFYIPYYIVTNLVGIILFVFVAMYVRATEPSLGGQWDPYLLRLAWLLRGRPYPVVFPHHLNLNSTAKHEEPATQKRKGTIVTLPQFPSLFSNLYDRVKSPATRESPVNENEKTNEKESPEDQDDDTTSVKTVEQKADDAEEAQPSQTEQAGEGEERGGEEARGEDELELVQVGEGEESESEESELVWDLDQNFIVAEEVQDMIHIDTAVPLLAVSDSDPVVDIVKNLPPIFQASIISFIKENVRSGENEAEERVVWAESPQVSEVIQHELMFLHMMITITTSSALFFLMAHDGELPVTIMVGGVGLTISGCVLLIGGLVTIATHLASCKRVYVMTTHNLITVYSGIWSPTIASTPNADVSCAYTCTYSEFGSQRTVLSWKQQAGTGRRMDAPPFHQFPCIKRVNSLVNKIKRFCPPLTSRNVVGSDELLGEWRILMSMVYILLLLSITTTHYNTVPANILALFVTCSASACCAGFMKGIRHHLTDFESITNYSKKVKSKWHRPRWRAKEIRHNPQRTRPVTEDVLDSLMARRFEGSERRLNALSPPLSGQSPQLCPTSF